MVIYFFVPLIIYSSPSFFADVSSDKASLPALGSVRANDPTVFPDAIKGKYLSFCLSVPKSSKACEQRPIVVEKRDL